MQDYNAKHAQVKILPRYKVKTEGEAVSTHSLQHKHITRSKKGVQMANVSEKVAVWKQNICAMIYF